MPDKPNCTNADLFIIDKSDTDWKAVNYPLEWASTSFQFDIAAGFICA